MLKNEIRDDSLFKELEKPVSSLGLKLVDVRKNIKGPTEIQVCITVMLPGGEVGIDECAIVHKTLQPRLEILIGRDILSMEVSTPGLQRIFRDVYEFSVFTGKRCRLYSTSLECWISGIIGESGSDFVVIENYNTDDSNSNVCEQSIAIKFEDIQKAKLDYIWEDVKKCPR